MNHHQVFRWGIVMAFVMSLLSGCGGASPTPAVIVPTPISLPIPTAIPPRAIVVPATVTSWPTATGTATITPTGETATLAPSATLPARMERPFLMRIDRISTIIGRGTLLQGRVANGTLQGNGAVEILGPQNNVLSAAVLAILISNIKRDQVTVGDYASILVEGVEAKDLSPGMLLAAAGGFESYEQALLQLQ